MNRRNFLSLGCVGTAMVLSGCTSRDDRQVQLAISERVDQESAYSIEVEAGDNIEIQIQTDDGDYAAIQAVNLDDQSVVQEFVVSNSGTLTLTAETSGEYRIRVTPESTAELTVRIK